LNYDVTIAGQQVTLTAKQNGEDTSLNNFFTSKNSVVDLNSINAGSDDTTNSFKIIADISTGDGLLSTLSGIPNPTCVEFNLEEYLRSLVSCPVPERGGFLKEATSVLAPYTLDFWEKVNGNICAKSSDTDHVAWNGGTANEFLEGFNPTFLYFEPDPSSQDPFERKFLTNAPNNRELDFTYLNWLYWYVSEATADVHYKVTYTDGTTQTLTEVVSGMNLNTVYAFRADLEYWRANVLDQSYLLIQKVELWIVTPTIESEHRTYTKRKGNNPVLRHFSFCNSLGVLDFLTTKNYQEKSTEVTSQNTKGLDHKNKKHLVNFVDSYTVSTGCISLEVANWLQELVVADDAYIYSNGKWIPIIVLTNDPLLWKDRRGYYQLEFTYRIAYDNKAVDHFQRIL
jgi:hypothetical protein